MSFTRNKKKMKLIHSVKKSKKTSGNQKVELNFADGKVLPLITLELLES